VSRVPVRDALQMLISMGIAINVPRRGVIVRPLSQKHLDDLFEMRRSWRGRHSHGPSECHGGTSPAVEELIVSSPSASQQETSSGMGSWTRSFTRRV